MRTWFERSRSCRVIAEVGQNHDGSLGTAHAYIDAVAKTGSDAIKFQTHIAEAESTSGEPWRVRFSPQDATRYDYWKRMEFAPSQWLELARHAESRGLIFLSSPFSLEAVELLEKIGMAAWKVGAGEITNIPMIERMAATGKPVLLSSGLASWADLDLAVEAVRRRGAEVGLFQCTTAYPCLAEKIGLNLIAEMRRRYRCPVGLSDHSGTIFSGLAAAALGAAMIEVHVAFSRECFGPDVPASVTTSELAQLVEGVRFVERCLRNPVDKEAMARELSSMRALFTKSIYASRDLSAGHQLKPEDLCCKKPGSGIPAARLAQLLDGRLKHAVAANTMLSEDDFEPAASS